MQAKNQIKDFKTKNKVFTSFLSHEAVTTPTFMAKANPPVVAKGYGSDLKRIMKFNFLPIRLCFINVHTYPIPKHTPYINQK